MEKPTSIKAMPVQSTERIDFVDILRGFAVYGILVFNIAGFSGQETNLANISDPLDRLIVMLVNFFVQAKFYSLFSFLFGWGMAIQMQRAEAKDDRFIPRYIRRLLILLTIGLIHTTLIWHGDILLLYALLGFILLTLRNASDRVLLLGVILCLMLSIILTIPGELMEAVRTWYNEFTSFMRPGLPPDEILATGSYPEIINYNFLSTLEGYSWIIYYVGNVFSMFLLGLVVGKSGIFQKLPAYLPLARIVLWIGLVVGVIFNAIFVYAGANPGWVPDEYQRFVTVSARTVGAPAFMLFYMAGIILLIQKKAWQERLAPLGNVGRMALSNYLLQSFICILIFYSFGLGLYGETSATVNQILVIIIFLGQVRISAWWFERYQFGPIEWIWRMLTYKVKPPLAVGVSITEIRSPVWVQRVGNFTKRIEPRAALIGIWILLASWGVGLYLWNASLERRVSQAPFEVIVKVTATPHSGRALDSEQSLAEPEDEIALWPVTPGGDSIVGNPESVGASLDVWALASSFDVQVALGQIATLSEQPYGGRHAASPAGWAAGDYIAGKFKEYGLQPAGGEGSYFQSFPVTYTPLSETPSLIVVNPQGDANAEYQLHKDYSPIIRWYSGPGETSGQVAWAGNCGANDFIGLNVVDKIVLCNGAAGAINFREASRAAIEHGATGMLMLSDPNRRAPDMGNSYYETWVPEPIPTFHVYPALAMDLLSGSGVSVRQLLENATEVEPFDLLTQVHMHVDTAGVEACAVSDCLARNVLGVLPGRDPKHADEVVIIGAHYDHLGEAPDGTVWPGANDDASGVAVLLEIARNWHEHEYIPLRSVVFAAWDAEEIGLLGSRHYVENPQLPLETTIAVYQLDMVGAGPAPLYISGEELLSNDIHDVANDLGIQAEISDMGRSDHVPFLEAGVPASMLIYFNVPETMVHYHRPVDRLQVIERDKLLAAANVVEIAALDLVESKPAIQELLARRSAAIEAGDIEAFLATSHPEQAIVDRYWFNDLRSYAPINVRIIPISIQVSGSKANADVELRMVFSSEAGEDSEGISSGRIQVRFERHPEGWKWAGPNLVSEAVTGSHQVLGTPSIEVLYPPEVDNLGSLGDLTAQKYAQMADQLGVQNTTDAKLMLFPSREALRVSTAMSLPSNQDSWVSAQEIKLVYTEGISNSVKLQEALAQHILARAGISENVAPWLWEGLPLIYKGLDEPVTTQVKYLPRLTESLRTGELTDSEVTSWAETDYLLWRLGWQGLGTFITDLGAACREGLCDNEIGLDSALMNALQLDAESFERLWQDHWAARLGKVQADLDDVLAARMRAALSGERQDLSAFLITVDPNVPHLLAHESFWFNDLIEHPLRTFTLNASPMALLADGSVLAMVGYHYQHADAEPDANDVEATSFISFTRSDDGYRWAGVPFEKLSGERLNVCYPTGMEEAAQTILDQAERIYPELAARLGVEDPDSVTIMIYDDDDDYGSSIALSHRAVDWAPGWTQNEAGIKLNVNPGATAEEITPTLVVQLVRNLLHQMGVEQEWLLKGLSIYLSGPFDGQANQKTTAANLPTLSQVAHDGTGLNLIGMESDDELMYEEFQITQAQSWDAVRYLVHNYGWNSILTYITMLSQNDDPVQAFQSSFEESITSFQVNWRMSFSRGHVNQEWIELLDTLDPGLAEQHVATLTSRELAGRKAGSTGSEVTSDYIARQFEEYGLIPAGDTQSTSFFQTFPISDTRYLRLPSLELLDEDSQSRFVFSFRDDFLPIRPVFGGREPVSGELVWVLDKEVQTGDLSGKIILLKISGPLAEKGTWEEEIAWALEQNARGMILIGTKQAPEEILAKRPDPFYNSLAASIPVLELTYPGYSSFLEEINHDRKSIENLTSGTPLGIEARLDFAISEPQIVETANVLGLLPGADLYLRSELVIIGAHYDHVGDDPSGEICRGEYETTLTEEQCESIPEKRFSGGNDDASGVAALLEIARVWSKAGYRPQRSVLFAAWGAQEPGQLGSNYFIQQPTVDLDELVGMVQLDGIAGGEGFQPGVQGNWGADGLLLYNLAVAQRILEEPLSITPEFQESDHTTFSEAGYPSVLMSWRLASEDNLPDGFAPAANPERIGVVARLAALLLMLLGQ